MKISNSFRYNLVRALKTFLLSATAVFCIYIISWKYAEMIFYIISAGILFSSLTLYIKKTIRITKVCNKLKKEYNITLENTSKIPYRKISKKYSRGEINISRLTKFFKSMDLKNIFKTLTFNIHNETEFSYYDVAKNEYYISDADIFCGDIEISDIIYDILKSTIPNKMKENNIQLDYEYREALVVYDFLHALIEKNTDNKVISLDSYKASKS